MYIYVCMHVCILVFFCESTKVFVKSSYFFMFHHIFCILLHDEATQCILVSFISNNHVNTASTATSV